MNEIGILALLNSSVSEVLLNVINPTLITTLQDVFSLSYKSNEKDEVIQAKTIDAVESVSKTGMTFETSWDFKRHPMI